MSRDGRTSLQEIFAAVRDGRISDAELRLWLLVRSFESGEHGCYADTETLAHHLSRSESFVRKARAALVARRWLRVTRRGPMSGEAWSTVPTEVPRQEPLEVPGGESQEVLHGERQGQEVPEEVPEEVPHGELPPTPPTEESTGSTGSTLFGDGSPARKSAKKGRGFPSLGQLPRNGHGRIYPPEFEGAFAALPPRHVPHPKAGAYQAWRARTREVAEVFQLEAAAEAYAEDVGAKGRAGTEYVLQAATFFGPGERWRPYLGRERGSLSVASAGGNGYRPALTAAEEEAREQARREAAQARSARAETEAQLQVAEARRRDLTEAKRWLEEQDEDTVSRINRQLVSWVRAGPPNLRESREFAESTLIQVVRSERAGAGVGA